MGQLRVRLMGLLGLSCGVSRSAVTSGPEPSSNGIPVQIDNRSSTDVGIYAIRGSRRWLLGQAGGRSRTTLTIPDALRGDGRVRLVARPAGGAAPIVTPTLLVLQGQRIFWTIGPYLGSSTASAG